MKNFKNNRLTTPSLVILALCAPLGACVEEEDLGQDPLDDIDFENLHCRA